MSYRLDEVLKHRYVYLPRGEAKDTLQPGKLLGLAVARAHRVPLTVLAPQKNSATFHAELAKLEIVTGRLGNGAGATAEAANAVSRMKALPAATVIEPRMLGGFQTLFHRIDERISDVLEAGVERGAFVQRVTVPRLVSGEGRLVHPVRERFVPVACAADLEVIRTAREHLRPRAEPAAASPGASRLDLHAALIHRPTSRDTPGAPRL